jgi:hypothetical protein
VKSLSDSDDESRLTSYAVGELTDIERHRLEAELGGCSIATQDVAIIQTTADTVRAALATEHGARLTSKRLRIIRDEVHRCCDSKRRFVGLRVLKFVAASAAIVLCAAMLVRTQAGSARENEIQAAHSLVRRLQLALQRYQADFQQLPPDTGFGLPGTAVSLGAGRTYDAGTLWRYLGREQHQNGKTFGPYINFNPTELKPYTDPIHGESFAVIDPWGTAVGYVGDSRRVIHNHGAFDLFSAGPDRKTGIDLARQAGANLAYDGQDNDGDGVIDNAQELGGAKLNGCLTLTLSDLQLPKDALDDLNNWDE